MGVGALANVLCECGITVPRVKCDGDDVIRRSSGEPFGIHQHIALQRNTCDADGQRRVTVPAVKGKTVFDGDICAQIDDRTCLLGDACEDAATLGLEGQGVVGRRCCDGHALRGAADSLAIRVCVDENDIVRCALGMKRFVKCFFELLTQIIVKVRKCKVQRVCVLHFQLAGSGGCFFLMKLYH